ncbi:unnamed protein product [Protopolystoma xenopodis]|uniref:Secreted protein n=1 Tax=Protopolystoma xenopodis TaxID=117903 RepID=A0A3S4ZSF3_9PLAT|nr:unnamed protein product [Protopolystoma xenopodis]
MLISLIQALLLFLFITPPFPTFGRQLAELLDINRLERCDTPTLADCIEHSNQMTCWAKSLIVTWVEFQNIHALWLSRTKGTLK